MVPGSFQPVPVPEDWKKDQGQAPELTLPKANTWDDVVIKIPSPWNVNGFEDSKGKGPDYQNFPSYPEHWDDVKMAWMKRQFTVPANWDSKRIKVHFEAVAGDAVILVNGIEVATNFDPFLPFTADVTDAVKRDAENEILVGVRGAKVV